MKCRGFAIAAALLLVAPGAAWAQVVKPTVAPAPLELRRKPASLSKKDTVQIINEFERLVRAAGARVPTPSEVKLAVDSLKDKDFAGSDEALAKLAQQAQTLYAVYLQLDYPVTGTVVAVGRVVRADGERMNAEVRVERSPESRPYLRATTEAVIAVLEKLDLQRLPSAMPVAAVVLGAPPPTPPPAPLEPSPVPTLAVAPSPGRKAKRVGPIVTGVGAAVMVGGAILLGSGAADAASVRPDANGNLPFEQIGLFQGSKTKLTYGGGLLGVGAAVALTGALVWLLSGDAPASAVALIPSREGFSACVVGSF